MKNLKIKPAVYIMLGVSALSWFLLNILADRNINSLTNNCWIFFKVATFDLLLIGIFTKWAWKLRLFKGWLVPFPNLNGSWQGDILSTWVNPDTGQKLLPIPAILTIKQTFLTISCVMRTAEMTSYSYTADFRIDRDTQIRQLVYSYTSNPKQTVSDRSPAHDGTIVFDLIGNPVSKINGNYWTARNTKGHIVMTFREKNLLEEFPSDAGQHPMNTG